MLGLLLEVNTFLSSFLLVSGSRIHCVYLILTHHSQSICASAFDLHFSVHSFRIVVAIEQMGGPEIPWRAGRKDAAAPTASTTTLPDGRLPNADMGCPSATNSHVRDIFGRMGFNDRYEFTLLFSGDFCAFVNPFVCLSFCTCREIVALLGAHAVGR